MKIGIFLPNATFDMPGAPEVGGIETFSFVIGEALQRLGHEVVLFGGQPKAGRKHRATSLTLEIHPYVETKSIPDIGTRFQRLVQRLHFARSIRHAWKKHRVDLVLLAKPFDRPVAWWWKKSRPELRTIMGFQGTDFFAGDRMFYSAVDAAFAVSPRVADLAEAHTGKRPAFIPNPVDCDVFRPVAPLAPREPWRIIGSGRLIGWKGFANLVEAVARLRRDHGIDAELTIAGEGAESDSLRKQAEALNVASHVHFPGRLQPEELNTRYAACGLYCQPSIGLDACPLATLEAASAGLPLLLSDQVGINDFISPLEAASYPARDVDMLVTKLIHLHALRSDPEWTDRAARHERMRAIFASERIAQAILDLVA